MANSYQAEQSNKVKGFTISLMVHAALILVFLFFYLTPPNPPLTEMGLGGGGIELNLGDPDAGTGDMSNLNESNPDPIEATESTAPEPNPEEQTEEPTPDEGENVDATVTPHEDAVAVKVSPKTTVKTDNTTKTEPNKTTTTPAPKVDDKFVMGKTTSNKSGENKNTPGDPGKKEGTVDGRALMGNPGKGGDGSGIGIGPNLGGGLIGWKFVTEPRVDDKTQEKGTLVFKIYVNDEGIIEKADVIDNKGGITPKLQLQYKQALVGTELALIAPGKKMPPRSEGTVTWEIKP